MKNSLSIFFALFIPFLLSAQLKSRKEIQIPDIPGYLTLKCDLHMHTVFSDGYVWPTIRADEAWLEGFDAIAVTEHIEYHPFEEDIPVNFGRSFEIIEPRAEALDLIVIRGAEITRQMPPGHFNCLFINDVAALDTQNFFDAIQAAAGQGAFIIWNHPGWRQEDEIPIWYDEHTRLYNDGLMHGMEIVNGMSYYPLAHQWCLEKNITMTGNSDIHYPIGMDYDLCHDYHRPITLVFAKKRTKEAIRKALFEGQTAVYYEDKIIGEEKFLKPIFDNSIQVVSKNIKLRKGVNFYLQVNNNSQVPFILKASGMIDEINFQDEVTLYPERTTILVIRRRKDISGKKSIKLPYRVENLMIDTDTGLPVEIEFEVNFE